MQFEQALLFVQKEKEQIEDATLSLRERIRKARRNYELKYDNPIDKATGKRKMFVPLVRQEVNLIAPRFELDPDAIVVETNEPGHERKALIWEELLRSQFKTMEWKPRMKQGNVAWVNEGTMVVELFWDGEKKRPDFVMHDIRDIFIFPKEPSLWEASAFGVKKRILKADFLKSERYQNKEQVAGSGLVNDYDTTQQTMQYEIGKSSYENELEFVELYERHGWFPKWFLSSDTESDEQGQDELVDGTITVAWIDGASVCVEVSGESHRRNFIEAPFIKRHYLWYGAGIGMALEDYQWYYNKMFNRRDDNEDVLHRGMFMKQRGTNIDATQRITGSGVIIETDSIANIQQLKTSDITQGSYVGEQNLLNNVRLLDGTEEIVRGGGSSRSASEAAIKDRNAGTRLADPQSNLAYLFQKAVQRVMELDREHLSANAIVKLTGRDEELAAFDDFKLSTINQARAEEGLASISDAEFQSAMSKFGGMRFLRIPNAKFLKGDFNVHIDIDASLLKNRSGQSQFIVDAMQIAAQVPGVASEIDFSDLFEKLTALNGLKVKRRTTPLMGEMPGGVESTAMGGSAQEQALGEVGNVLAQSGAPTAAAIA